VRRAAVKERNPAGGWLKSIYFPSTEFAEPDSRMHKARMTIRRILHYLNAPEHERLEF